MFDAVEIAGRIRKRGSGPLLARWLYLHAAEIAEIVTGPGVKNETDADA